MIERRRMAAATEALHGWWRDHAVGGTEASTMTKEQEGKSIATRWLGGFWGHAWNSRTVDDLAADDILPRFSLQMPRRGPEEAKRFQAGIREMFPELEFRRADDLTVDGEYILRQRGPRALQFSTRLQGYEGGTRRTA